MKKPGIGILIADKAPPPDRLKKSEPDDDEMGGASDKDEDDAAEMSAMEEFTSALKDGSTEEKVTAFRNLLAACRASY